MTRWRLGAMIGLIGAIGGLWLGFGVGSPTRGTSLPGSQRSIPQAALVSISRYLGGSERAYWARPGGSGWSVAKRLGHYAVGYSAAGARLNAAGGGDLQFTAPRGATPAVTHNRVTYRSGSESEWFSDGPAGLEQGWTLQSPPQAAARGGEVTLPVTTTGTLRPVWRGGRIEFVTAGGRPALAYGGLSATDARGHDLKASLSLSSGSLQVRVDARGASYPIVVDPTITAVDSSSLLEDASGDQAANGNLGEAVATDGSTIVVGEPDGAPCGEADGGQVDVFTEPSGGWSGTLTPVAVLGNPQDSDTTTCNGYTSFEYGQSVAVGTANGTETIVVGDADDSDGDGAVYLYNEPAGGWGALADPDYDYTQQLSTDDGDLDGQGTSVAIDDNTIAVGDIEADAIGGDTDAGTVDLYTFNGDEWQQVATLSTATDNEDEDAGIGTSVALADTGYGTVVVSGARSLYDPDANAGDGGTIGGALVWVEPSGGWEDESDGNGGDVADVTSPSTILRNPVNNDSGFDGAAIAIDPSGSPVVVGAPEQVDDESDYAGVAYVYAATGGWDDAAAEMLPDATLKPATVTADQFTGAGVGVAGGTVWVTDQDFQGGVDSNGAVLEYTEPSGGWSGYGDDTPESEDLFGAGSYSAGSTGGSTLAGNSAALAVGAGGSVVVAGAENILPGEEGPSGGALVWQLSATPPPTTTTTTTTTPAPTPVAKPTGGASVSGIAAAGETLTCHADGWTGSPTLTYSWTLNGQLIAGAGGSTLTLSKADAGSTIVCAVTGKNSGGSTTVDSGPVSVGVCVVPTGSIHGNVLGPVHLGMAATDVLALFPKQNQTHYGTQRFCVVGGDERVEFPTQKLLHSLKAGLRRQLKQRVVMELTANPIYQIHGVKHGISVAGARKQMKLGPGYRIGANTWYLIANHGDDVLIKSRHGIVQEIGFVNRRLIAAGGLVRFFSTFLNSGITL